VVGLTVTAAQQAEQQAAQNAVIFLALQEWAEQVAEFQSLPARQAAAFARDVVAELVDIYGDEAASVNRDWYDDLRAELEQEQGITLPAYTALLADPWEADAVQGQLNWVLAPLFLAGGPNFEQAESRLDGKLAWLIGEMGRDTIATSAANDPIGTMYGRHAREDACAFCKLMATRGASYLTEESALFVVGEIDPRTFGQKRAPRGPRAEGEKYHDECRCVAVPVFPGDTLETPAYAAGWFDDYKRAARAAGGASRADLSTILANMRILTGAS
jgi:hypothetical protein